MEVRAALCAGIFAVVVGAAPVAHAEEPHETGTPRYGALRFQFGPYKPSHMQGGAYTETFGNSSMSLFNFDYDRYLYQGIGAFGLGFSIGYGEKYSHAVTADHVETAVPTAIHLVPLKLQALYNFDWLALEHGIPLVPYVKAGPAYVPWWSTKGDETDTINGKKVEGGTFGFAETAGLSFMLDVLEPRLQRDFDSSVGVNHTYLYAEYTALQASSFGHRLNVSDNYWMFGVSFEF
jgi:hypothetical protein